jgi:hypothetical protein
MVRVAKALHSPTCRSTGRMINERPEQKEAGPSGDWEPASKGRSAWRLDQLPK